MEISAPGWMQRHLGDLICQGLRQLGSGRQAQGAVDRFGVAWSSAAPVFALTQQPAPQRAQNLQRPQETPEWSRSRARRLRSRVKPHDAHLLGLAYLPGEVDHVAGHPDSDVIWVIDDKDLAEVYTPAEIARGVTTFNKPGGEIDKLIGKIAVITANASSVGTALGLDGSERQVRGLFVTRRPVPAAYVASPRIEFTTFDDLRQTLKLPGV